MQTHTILIIFIKAQYICKHLHYRYVQSGPHVIWIDNFSKILSRSIPSEQKGLYTSALWTGVAAFSGDTADLDDGVRVDGQGDIVPAMPDNLLQYNDAVMNGIRATMRTGQYLYSNSLCEQYDVRTIPPKLDCKRFPELCGIVDDGSSTLSSVHPVDMLPQNIGSNRGFISIIRSFYEHYKMDTDDCKRYLTINADENIFWRILKVREHKTPNQIDMFIETNQNNRHPIRI